MSDCDFFETNRSDMVRYGLRPSQIGIEVRWQRIPGREFDDSGQRVVDEIIATGVRLEMMDESNCWMDVNGLRVWIRAVRVKGQREPRLYVTAEPESCSPVPTKRKQPPTRKDDR